MKECLPSKGFIPGKPKDEDADPNDGLMWWITFPAHFASPVMDTCVAQILTVAADKPFKSLKPMSRPALT